MPRLTSEKVPTYCRHRASGQAVVALDGRDYYLGPWKSAASHVEYDRLIIEWLAGGRTLRTTGSDLTVVELMAAYRRFAKSYYVKNGLPTSEQSCIRYALEPLRRLYGRTRAAEFGPLRLKGYRQALIDSGLCRNVVNQRVGIVRRMFRWATAEELLPITVYQSLATVAGLKSGRCNVREATPVRPVAHDVVDATLPFLPPVVADMVRLQRLTGARPGEICMLRPCDVDTSGEVWLYRPESHKTQHHGRERRIYIGPQAQDVLRKYLLRPADQSCFSPADSERQRKRSMRERRKSPVQPSQLNRSKVKPKRTAGIQYNKDAYCRAVRRACELAFPAPDELNPAEIRAWNRENAWSPNQLRHLAATAIRARFSLEAAQCVLGHADPKVTMVYAEQDFAQAADIMRRIG